MLESNKEEVWEEVDRDGSAKKLPRSEKGSKSEKKLSKEKILDAADVGKTKSKLTLDFKDDEHGLQLLQSLLVKANDKKYGKTIEILELVKLGLSKITEEDLQGLQDKSMSKMDKIHLAHEKSNLENKTDLPFDEFLFRQLNIQ